MAGNRQKPRQRRRCGGQSEVLGELSEIVGATAGARLKFRITVAGTGSLDGAGSATTSGTRPAMQAEMKSGMRTL
jgi:hypothetical protein